MIRHVAMFKWRDGITDDEKVAARDSLANLPDVVPTIKAYSVGFDLGRKPANWDMVLVGDFEDREALEAYFAHPTMNAASDLVASATKSEITARVQFEM